MSTSDLYQDLWKDEIARSNRLMRQKHEFELRTIRLESERISMLMTLQLAANCLTEHYPHFAAVVTERINNWRTDVPPQKTEQPQGTPAGDSTSDHGSAGPAGSAQAETPAGTAQSTHGLPYIDLPVAVRQQQWDSVAPATGDLT